MTPDLLARSLQEFLAASRSAVVMEDGQVLFDLETAQYSLSSEKGRCLLHMWSPERNVVRQVLDAELKNGILMLTVRRFGQARPIKMEICRDRDRRPPTVQKAARSHYARLLERALRRKCRDGHWINPGSQLRWTWSAAFLPCTRAGCFAKAAAHSR
jgi:hypothetical protein